MFGTAVLAGIIGLYVYAFARDAYNKRHEIKEAAQEFYSQASELIFPRTPSQENFEDELLRYK